MKNPCKECDQRSAECHADCPKYVAFRHERNRLLKEIGEQKKATPGLPKKVQEYIWREMKQRKR